MRRSIWSSALLLVVAGCTNAGETLTLPPLADGAIGVGVYFDRDGSGTFTNLDTTASGVRIALLSATGQDTLRVLTTNGDGVVTFDSVAIGSYRLVVDRAALNDSVGVVAGDTGSVRLLAQNDSIQSIRTIRLGYAEVSVADARALAPGRRVLVRGKVTSPLQAFHDSSAFLADTSGALRIVGATPRFGGGGNNIGDSVLVLGTTGVDLGQPVLVNGAFLTYGRGVAPVPLPISIAEAATADSGALDAAVVQLSNVAITDTATTGVDFVVTVADSATADSLHQPLGDTIHVVIDQLIGAPHGIFIPGRTATFRGVLVPLGAGTWVLKPRNALDIILN